MMLANGIIVLAGEDLEEDDNRLDV